MAECQVWVAFKFAGVLIHCGSAGKNDNRGVVSKKQKQTIGGKKEKKAPVIRGSHRII
jgi:hypothetical protein